MKDEDQPRTIRDLKNALYQNTERQEEHPRHTMYTRQDRAGVRDDWGGPPIDVRETRESPREKPFFKILFLISFIFMLGAGVFAYWKISTGTNLVSPENIDVSIFGNAFVDGGSELILQVEIGNRNSAPLANADLFLSYPAKDASTEEFEIQTESLGRVGIEDSITSEFALTLFGEEGSARLVTAELQYRVEGSNAIFTKKEEFLVTLRSSPLQLFIDAPEQVVRNQETAFTINVVSNATNVQEEIILEALYPEGFEFLSASPEPSVGNNRWLLGDFEPQQQESILVRGVMPGNKGEQKSLRVSVGTEDPLDPKLFGVLFNVATHRITLTQSFVTTEMLFDGQSVDSYTIEDGESVRVELVWTNTTSGRLDNIDIRARIYGNALDPTLVSPRTGFYDSTNGYIIWDRSSNPELASAESGATDRVSFDIIPKENVVGVEPVFDPVVRIDIDVYATEESGLKREAVLVATGELKKMTDLRIVGNTLHYSGPFTNSGPMPPQAGQKTTYTLRLSATNSVNSIRDAEVYTTLPRHVEYLGVVSPESTNVSFSEGSRRLSWKIDELPAGTGFAKTPREVFVQFAITPSVTQINTSPELTDRIIIEGTDVFSGTLVRSSRTSLTTLLSGDTSPVGASGKVE